MQNVVEIHRYERKMEFAGSFALPKSPICYDYVTF